MNIFILSKSIDFSTHIAEQAHFHCDRHVVKMIAESTQMLVTAFFADRPYFTNLIDRYGLPQTPCKPLAAGHANHPCAIWTRACTQHIKYVASLALELCYEHQHRYPLNPRHAYMEWLEALVDALHEEHPEPWEVPTHFAVAIRDRPELRSTSMHRDYAVVHYRNYYVRDKARFATWKRRDVPQWFSDILSFRTQDN